MPEERNAELYSPPYLSKGPRPTITDAPSLVGYGTDLQRARRRTRTNIAKVSLIRLGSVTHAFDMNGRLPVADLHPAGRIADDHRARRAAPQAPPGHYMLFLVEPERRALGRADRQGGRAPPEPTPGPNAAPVAVVPRGLRRLELHLRRPEHRSGRQPRPSGSGDFGDGQISTARDPSHAYQSGGTYTVRLTAQGPRGRDAPSLTRQVTVPGPQYSARADADHHDGATKQTVTLTWTRAQGPIGLHLSEWPGAPEHARTTASRPSRKNAPAPATYIFKVCEAGTHASARIPRPRSSPAARHRTNSPPNAAFTPVCDAATPAASRTAAATRMEPVTAWQWSFGDGDIVHPAESVAQLTAPAGTYHGATHRDRQPRRAGRDHQGRSRSGTRRTRRRRADFTSSCTGLDCEFTDGSSGRRRQRGWLALGLRRRRDLERPASFAQLRDRRASTR